MKPENEYRELEIKDAYGRVGRVLWRGVYQEQLRQATWRVIFNGVLTTPRFNDEGPARAYLDMLIRGERQPEYVGSK